MGSFPGSFVNADHRGDTTLSELRQAEVLFKVGTLITWSKHGLLRTNKRLSAGSKLLAYDICTMACVEIINPSDQNLYDGMHVTRETQCHMLQAT